MRPRASGQSLVELALVAPILILLAMSAWDGGSVLREQVILQQAARDGARVAATAYGPTLPNSIVADAVRASAADLPSLANTPGYLSIAYPDAQSVQVRVTYAHALITPVLRRLWGGQGVIMLSASATFYLPQLTPVPATIVASTPIPSATPTPPPTATPTATPTVTPTLTPTLTPTATQTPAGVSWCIRQITIPPLRNSTGYFVTVQLTVPSVIAVGWSALGDAGGQMQVYIYAGNPFGGQPNPTQPSFAPPPGALISSSSDGGSVGTITPGAEPAGQYSVYFYMLGADLSYPTSGGLAYQSRQCP